ncbi:putative reverse transcriptase domain-containing protein [Tanacetum coccineum]
MAMNIQYGVSGMILPAQSEASKQENILAERPHGLDQQMERKEDESLYFMDRIWVSLVGAVRTIIMDEAHKTRYSVHLKADKMYYDLRDMYWWPGNDRLTKLAHFLAIREDYKMEKLERLYIDEIVARHRVPVSIISDCDRRFNSRFLVNVADDIGNTARYEYNVSPSNEWTSVRCAPFEALYGRKCRSPILWVEIREIRLIGIELVHEITDKVILIKERLKAARDCQNSYVGNRCKQLGFEVGDKVILEVSSW